MLLVFVFLLVLLLLLSFLQLFNQVLYLLYFKGVCAHFIPFRLLHLLDVNHRVLDHSGKRLVLGILVLKSLIFLEPLLSGLVGLFRICLLNWLTE